MRASHAGINENLSFFKYYGRGLYNYARLCYNIAVNDKGKRAMQYFIGLDIGGTKSAVSLGAVENGEIEILAREEYPTQGTPAKTLEKFDGFFKKYVAQYPIERVGISCGGPLNSHTGEIVCPPNLPLWHHFNIVEYVENRYRLTAKLENDANACALAEWRFGAGKDTQDMIFLTFGTGLGAGVISGGRLLVGANGNAGEAGHIRLSKFGPVGYHKRGSFEGFCSGAGIAELAKLMSKKEKILPKFMQSDEKVTTKQLAEAAKNGDSFALKVFKKSGDMLGRGLSVLIDLFNPEKIVIGGVFMRSGELLIPSMEKRIKKEALKESLAVCKIVPAKLQENIGDFAAIAVALR